MKWEQTRWGLVSAGIALASMNGVVFAANGSGSGSEGHGGGSFVCMDANKRILSAESQDLWEASTLNGLALRLTDQNEIEQSYTVIARIKNINPKFFERVKQALDDVLAQREILPVAIQEAGDSKHRYEKQECVEGSPDFAQAAFYEKNNRIVYSQEIWNAMLEGHRAALNVHEAVYKVLRHDYGDTDSKRTRGMVGMLFSFASDDALRRVIPAFRFHPNNEMSADEKHADLLRRFEEARIETPLTGEYNNRKGRKQVRTCYKLELREGWIQRSMTQEQYVFLIDERGLTLWTDFHDNRCKSHLAYSRFESTIDGYREGYAGCSVGRYWYGVIKMARDSHGDLIMLSYPERYGKAGIDDYQAKCVRRGFWGCYEYDQSLSSIRFCPNPELPLEELE